MISSHLNSKLKITIKVVIMLVARLTETPNLNARSSTGQSRRIRMRVIRISSSRERMVQAYVEINPLLDLVVIALDLHS